MRFVLYLGFSRQRETKLDCLWPRWFRAKNHSVDDHPSVPSIRKLSHFLEGRRELRFYPVLNWKAFFEYSQTDRLTQKPACGRGSKRAWPLSIKPYFLYLKPEPISVLRQTFYASYKKLACSLSSKYWPDVKELQLEKLTGNKRFGTLSK